MGNIQVKLYEVWTRVSVGDVIQSHFLSRTLAAICSVDWDDLCNFGRRHH